MSARYIAPMIFFAVVVIFVLVAQIIRLNLPEVLDRDIAHGETACQNHGGLSTVRRHWRFSDRVLTIKCVNGHETYSPYRGE